MNRFIDKAEGLQNFYDYRIVGCPNCSKPVDFIELRVTCVHCGYHKEFKPLDTMNTVSPITVAMEDYLIIPCCGQELWAMNLEHLDFIQRYVSSELRERIPNINASLASRLPKWIKDKKNRLEILKSIEKLRSRLKEENYIRTVGKPS